MKGGLDGEGRDAGMASGSGGSESDKDANLPNPEVQEGVKKVEAVTLTWTRRELWIAYGLFVCFSLLPYPIITSSAQSSPSLQGLAYDCLATRRRKQANKFWSVYLVFFVVSMEQQIQNNLSIYVTSSFALLPLTSTTQVVSSVVGGVVKLPTAKFIDLVGRAEGFGIMAGLTTIGEWICEIVEGLWESRRELRGEESADEE